MESKPEEVKPEQAMSNKKAWTILAIIALIGLGIYSVNYYRQSVKKETGVLIKDALTGSQNASNKDQAEITKDFFESVRNIVQKTTPHDQKLATANLLQIESFTDVKGMRTIVTDLQAAAKELKILRDQYFDIMNAQIEAISKNNTGNEAFIAGIKKGFIETYNDPELKAISNRKFDYTIDFYNQTAKLYMFLIANFNGYVIDNDENNNLNIFFDDDKVLAEFQSQWKTIDALSVVAQKSQQELLDYMNKVFANTGVSGQDIVDYIRK